MTAGAHPSDEKPERQTVRLYRSQIEILDARIDAEDPAAPSNRSVAIRELIEAGGERDQRVEELSAELEDYRTENARLENQYQVLVSDRQSENLPAVHDPTEELVRFAARERARAEASFPKRLWWKLTGQPPSPSASAGAES